MRGIGPKRAAYVLSARRTLERARIPPTWWGERLLADLDSAFHWRDVIRLRRSERVDVMPLNRPTPELPKAADVCDALGLWV